MNRALPPAAGAMLILSVMACAKNIYVDPVAGKDENPGVDARHAVKTLAVGVRLCGPGDTLDILPGKAPIPESLHFLRHGGRPGKPITVHGNGAILTGLRPIRTGQWQRRGPGLWFFPTKLRHGSLRPFLVDADGSRIPAAPAGTAAPAPGTARWDKTGVLFHCAPGRELADYGLRGTLSAAGVAIRSSSYITVHNLTCEYFANDGFNVHGSCYGLRFENIEARHNGDDGFSVHEDVGATVNGGWFHDNSYGIQDVNASRSMYCGVLAENNRGHGIHFVGGIHSLIDSVSRNNAIDQVRVDRGAAPHLRMDSKDPLFSTTVYLCNDVILGGRYGLGVTADARVSARSCYIAGSDTGVLAGQGSVVHVFGSVVVNCTKRELECESTEGHFAANLYFPGRIRWGKHGFTPAQFGTYRSTSGQDANSAIGIPRYAADNSFQLTAPALMVGDRNLLPGLVSTPVLPRGGELHNPHAPTPAAPASTGPRE